MSNFDFADFVKRAYQNSVDHGFHDHNRSHAEALDLIHSEWSEALDSMRKGEQGHFYIVKDDGSKKPEGYAVEIVDGIIRIADYLGEHDWSDKESEICYFQKCINRGISTGHIDFFSVIANLNYYTSVGYFNALNGNSPCSNLIHACKDAWGWLSENGFDPAELIEEKHTFNKNREYLHGKKF